VTIASLSEGERHIYGLNGAATPQRRRAVADPEAS
jgi:hypothetical protein